MANLCFICDKELSVESECVSVKTKGIANLINSSKARFDNKWKSLVNLENVLVHKDCRKNYTRPDTIRKCVNEKEGTSNISPVKGKLRSNYIFKFKENCLFCDNECSKELEKKLCKERRDTIIQISTLHFKQSIIDVANKRNDEWGKEVLKRLNSVICLVSEESKYHKSCERKFCSTNPVDENKKRGRPQDEDLANAFSNLCDFLESENECQFGLHFLNEKMEGTCDEKTLKNKLINKYGDDIIITKSHGRKSVVSFKNTGFKVLTNAWYDSKKENEEEERLRIVEAAATIIREDIRSFVYETDSFPPPNQFMDDVKEDIPKTLLFFLSEVCGKNKKTKSQKYDNKFVALAHAIINCCRPRSFISPILLGLGLYLHRHFGTKRAIDIFSNFGFCASYTDVYVFETSSLLYPQPKVDRNSFSQFVFDNADFNINTIDGYNTFHTMGGIQCVVPKNAIQWNERIQKLKTVVTAETMGNIASIPIISYEKTGNMENKIIIQDFNIIRPTVYNMTYVSPSELHWMCAQWLGVIKCPGWNGFMETLTDSREYQETQISFLPFVNLPPSSPDCIHSVLIFAAQECKKLNQRTCFVTFDQPLYIKARNIVESSKLNPQIVVRLGGFHLLMSFMGSIGYIMAGSGLRELWNTIYAANSIDKMMTGHAYSRAVRAHMLTQLCLSKIILDEIELTEEYKITLKNYISSTDYTTSTLEDIENHEIIQDLIRKVENQIKIIASRGKTATLWIQYFYLVHICRQFIYAERIGNWYLHLECVEKMIPFFHSTGHFQYAKSAHLYLQDMYQLEKHMHLEEFQKFCNEGYFTIKRSSKFWCGTWSDMTIEQTLMRSMKTSGGLTNGRGFQNSVLVRWLIGTPVASTITDQIEQFTNTFHFTSEQHVDQRDSRIKIDNKHIGILSNWLNIHNPFPELHEIMSISTGVVGNEQINCYQAQEVGQQTMKNVIGDNFSDIKLQRANRVVSLDFARKLTVCIRDEILSIDPLLLFQRIMIRVKTEEELKECFEYELSPIPLSLFDESGQMRKTKKSILYDVFLTTTNTYNVLDKNVVVVIDGGFLLHRVVWPSTSTYGNIIGNYVNYVKRHYGSNCVVVFDGYANTELNIKNSERQRRKNMYTSTNIIFEESMDVLTTQEKFLSNTENKMRLITMLTEKFLTSGILVRQAEDDADLLIVNTAIRNTDDNIQVVVIGEDIDLLILLLTLSPPKNTIIFEKPGRGKIETRSYAVGSLQEHFKNEIKYFMFIHAIGGCDTTSALFQQGKIKHLKTVKKHQELHDALLIFNNESSSPEEIERAGEKYLLALYKAPAHITSLNKLRHDVFQKTAASNKKQVQLARLPPTIDAAREHLHRVYLQIQLWRGNKLEFRSTELGLERI
ncbi:uncharacterized protein LOC100571724 isoform X2 [Acyrthosiphon pisum]|uniref:Uncharacterized protein n=1 Tax=Acyrthosiphon pisum TaxID=7029 RepID=A0A8R2JLX7_ACYPI|nr:uncharacterized protein LOC100571724 isoform X1 [Acyrthosiphon pisum]XP_029341749.1 uncharacterized protein LOC100571724 isoform X2 [Acyrthosiphon pisum]